MTEEEFTEIFSQCSATVADRFYPKGESGRRRSEYLRDQGILAALLAEAFKKVGVIATLSRVTARSPIDALRPHLNGHTYGAIRSCYIVGEDIPPPETVGEIVDICHAGKLGKIRNLGPKGTREVLIVLARADLINPVVHLA